MENNTHNGCESGKLTFDNVTSSVVEELAIHSLNNIGELTESIQEHIDSGSLQNIKYREVMINNESQLEFVGKDNVSITESPTNLLQFISMAKDEHQGPKLLSIFINLYEHLSAGSKVVFFVGAVMQRYNLAYNEVVDYFGSNHPKHSMPRNEDMDRIRHNDHKLLSPDSILNGSSYKGEFPDSSDDSDKSPPQRTLKRSLVSSCDSIEEVYQNFALEFLHQANGLGNTWEDSPVVQFGEALLRSKGIQVEVRRFREFIEGPRFSVHLKLIRQLKSTDDVFRDYFERAITTYTNIIRKRAEKYDRKLADCRAELFLEEEFAAVSYLFETIALANKGFEEIQLSSDDQKLLDTAFAYMAYPFRTLDDFPHAYLFISLMKLHFEHCETQTALIKFMRINFSNKLKQHQLESLGFFGGASSSLPESPTKQNIYPDPPVPPVSAWPKQPPVKQQKGLSITASLNEAYHKNEPSEQERALEAEKIRLLAESQAAVARQKQLEARLIELQLEDIQNKRAKTVSMTLRSEY